MVGDNAHRNEPSDMTPGSDFAAIQHELDSLREGLRAYFTEKNLARDKELDAQRDLLTEQITSIEKVMTAKLDAIHEATDLRVGLISNIPAQIAEEIKHHEALQIERLKSIDQRFNERDIRTEQASATSAQALAAALQAAKELVGAQGEASAAAAVKSETSFTKQIDQIGALIQTGNAASDARITELKERIDRGEGTNLGAREAKVDLRDRTSDNRSGNTLLLSVLATFFVAVSLILGVLSLFLGK